MNYSKLIEDILKEQVYLNRYNYVPVEMVIDRERDHYLLVQVGWINGRRIYSSILHLDIIQGKIYIQENNTELYIAEKLVELGVPKTDIVIGFHSQSQRKLTEYAVS